MFLTSGARWFFAVGGCPGGHGKLGVMRTRCQEPPPQVDTVPMPPDPAGAGAPWRSVMNDGKDRRREGEEGDRGDHIALWAIMRSLILFSL